MLSRSVVPGMQCLRLKGCQRAGVAACRYSACSARQTVWSGAEEPGLHPVAGLRPTRRLKRPAHPDGHRCGVPKFAGVPFTQGPDACTTEDCSALLHMRPSTRKQVRTWPSAVGPGQPEAPLTGFLPLSGVVTQTPLYVTVTQLSFPHCASPSHKGIVPA